MQDTSQYDDYDCINFDDEIDFYHVPRPKDKEKRSTTSFQIRRRPKTTESRDTTFQLELPPMSKSTTCKNSSLPASAKRIPPPRQSHLIQLQTRSPNKTYIVSDGKSIMVTQLRAPVIPVDKPVEKKKVTQKQQDAPNSANMQELLDDFMKNKKLEDESMAYPLSKFAKVQLDKAIEEDDYQRGEEFHKAIRLLNKIAFPAAPPTPIVTTSERIASATREIDMLNKKHDERLEAFHNDRQKINEQRKSRQEQEIENMTNYLGTNKFLMPFQKPSGVLLNEKRKQKESAKIGDFEKAKNLKRITDQMSQDETEQAKQRALTRAENMHLSLVEKHSREEDCANQNEERLRMTLDMDREADIEPIRKRIEQLERGVHPPLYVF